MCSAQHLPQQSDAIGRYTAASIGQHRAVDVLQRLHLAISLDRRAHRLRPRRDQQRHRRLCMPCSLRLLGDIGGAAHILIGGIGAAADQRGRDWSMNPFLESATSAASRDIGRARSGECGPTIWGSSFDRSSSTTLVVVFALGERFDLVVGFQQIAGAARTAAPGRVGRSRGDIEPCARRLGTSTWWRRAPLPYWRSSPCRWR